MLQNDVFEAIVIAVGHTNNLPVRQAAVVDVRKARSVSTSVHIPEAYDSSRVLEEDVFVAVGVVIASAHNFPGRQPTAAIYRCRGDHVAAPVQVPDIDVSRRMLKQDVRVPVSIELCASARHRIGARSRRSIRIYGEIAAVRRDGGR